MTIFYKTSAFGEGKRCLLKNRFLILLISETTTEVHYQYNCLYSENERKLLPEFGSYVQGFISMKMYIKRKQITSFHKYIICGLNATNENLAFDLVKDIELRTMNNNLSYMEAWSTI